MLLQKKALSFLFVISTMLLITACNSARMVQRRGGYILTRNSLKIDNPYLPAEEVDGFVMQKPAKGRLSFFRPGIWVFETTVKGKQTRFKKYLRNAFGTEPVILDTNMTRRSVYDISRYMLSKGFPKGEVKPSFRYGKRTASVTYTLHAGLPYKVRKLDYIVNDTAIRRLLFADTSASLLSTGMIFDTYVLDSERDRITKNLKNNGYFNFTKSYITYLSDTSQGTSTADLTLIVNQLRVRDPRYGDSLISVNHPRSCYRNIYLMPDPAEPGIADTITWRNATGREDSTGQIIHVINPGQLKIKPSVLADAILMESGRPYSQDLTNLTYKKLMNMAITRSANISFSSANTGISSDQDCQWLDCAIRLSKNRLNSLTLGTEGTNSAGSFGMGFNTLYQNRNIFRGAETFRIKLNAGAELQGNIPASGSERKFLIFNTFESGLEAGIDIPRLLLPFHVKGEGLNSRAHTSISAGTGFESRPDYRRTITTLSYNYQWNATDKVRHFFTPVELNFVNIIKDSAFSVYLNSLSDPLFRSQYNNHLLTTMRYSLVLNMPGSSKTRDVFFFRINLESSGNVLYVFDKLTGKPASDEGYYSYFNVRYSQFLRGDIDLRKYWPVRKQSSVALRVAAGIGFPFGNSEALPFEKTFWLGGANDMRAWKLRSLGPGNYTAGATSYDRTGEIMFVTSLEYRFPIYNFIYGGLFADAGNIWLREANPDFPGAEFRAGKVLKQVAVGTGFGLRFDFSFFILRLDWGVRTKNPALAKQWFNSEDFRINKAVWNFGIGMPF